MAGVATFSAPASAQEDRVDVMVAVDPSDASVAVPTAEVSRRLSAAVGKPVRVVMASGLKDAKRASRTSENQVLIAPAHVAASAISHGYKLAGLSSATRTFVLVSQPQIASVQALKGKRLYLPQQDLCALTSRAACWIRPRCRSRIWARSSSRTPAALA